MKKKSQNLFYFLLVSHIYCLILGGYSGEKKLDYLGSYFFHFLTGGCVGNSLLTIAFIFGKSKNPNTNSYFSQIFSLITMISNLVSMVIYGVGIVIGLATNLTNYGGLTKGTKNKLVPIPNHAMSDPNQVLRVVRGWFYSPLWHFIAPIFFVIWFFRHAPKDYLRKRLKLTIFTSFVLPTTYFLYCYLRSRFGDKKYFKDFQARGPYFFLSSKSMSEKLAISRFTGKIILVLFGFGLFSLIIYFSIRFHSSIKNFFVNKKHRKKQHISFSFKCTN